MDTVFSHRPLAGVSVGAFNDNGRLYVGFSIVNDGTSRNGLFWRDRKDTFSRATARSIINGRIASAVAGNTVPLTLVFETPVTSRQFIAALRETFKPTTDETDDFLSDQIQFPEFEIEIRTRPLASEIADRLTALANEIVANAGTRV